MSIPATALMITWPFDQNVPRTSSLHQCSIRLGSWPTSSSEKWSSDAEHRAALPAEARLADAGQPLVGADEHDDHRERVVLGVALAVPAAERPAWPPTATGSVSISVIFICRRRSPAANDLIVDVHTHVGEYPAHIGETFASEAREAWPEVTLGGTLDDHYRDALADVDAAIVLAFNAPAAGFVVPNDYVAEYVARDPARLVGFGAVDPHDGAAAIDELERFRDLGLVGCKLGPIYQDVDPLSPEFLAVCAALERLELPMLIHQGTTFSRAGSLLQARPVLLDEIALRHPELRIVIAHMGHPWFDEAIAVVRRHPNVYADVSALVCRRWLLYKALVAAVEYRVTHKLLFGTDFPFFTARQTIDGLRSVTGAPFGPRPAAHRRAGRSRTSSTGRRSSCWS